METFLKDFGIFGTGLLVWSGLITLTWKTDEAIASDPRRRLANRLGGIEVREDIDGWPEFFARMFDRVFGEKHLSWRCFWRSCVASLLAVTVMILVWWTVVGATTAGGWLGWLPQEIVLVILLGFGGLFNVLPDYLSLLETRALLRLMGGRGGRAARIAAILIVDAIATCLIIWAGYIFVSLTIGVTQGNWNWSIAWMWVLDNFWPTFTFSGSDSGVFSVFFYSTFFTSVWLWLYALAYGVMLAARKVGPVFRFLQWLLPLEAKPLRSLGLVSGAIGCIGYWIFGFLFIAPA